MEYEYKNTVALQKLKTEFKSKVELVHAVRGHAQGAQEARRPGDQGGVGEEPAAKKVYASVNKFEAPSSTTGA